MNIRTSQLIIAAIFSLVSDTVFADQVGRLFFTPEQRATLDMARNNGGMSESALPSAQTTTSITVNGIVKRSDGKNTLWLNQVSQSETEQTPSQRNLSRHTHLPTIPVSLPGTGRTAYIRVGQTLDIESGAIRESYQPDAARTAPSNSPQPPA